jgi:hypothetical protein
MSDTPRTDEMCQESEWCPRYKVLKLERELNAAIKERDSFRDKAAKYDAIIEDRLNQIAGM